ncbi:ribonuclease toxin immunity protein CdiI [Actinobacillus vicugnae]|uniref:ribonuclease toxin immunity protein CdiI n=1 Tax=Actinobacillus vicugnae TaxID=2573093 RepID=UPI00123F73CD|nr:ribonuclease toxin immunity protein CdiI [Actinobacillus vicugnae]
MFILNNQCFGYTPKKNLFSDGSGSTMDFFYGKTEILNNPDKTIKSLFSVLYHDGMFLEAIYDFLLKYEDFIQDGCYWYYSDSGNYKIYFELGFNEEDWIVEVSEDENFHFVEKACVRFLEIHPDEKYSDLIRYILENWKPLYKENIS